MTPNLTITLGGTQLDPLVAKLEEFRRTGSNPRASGKLRVSLVPSELSRLNLSNWLLISENETNRLFSGFVDQAEDFNGAYEVAFSDPDQPLKETRIGGTFGQGLSIPEVIFYIVSLAMPGQISPDTIEVEHGKALSDFPLLFNRRVYTYIAPIPCVQGVAEPITVLDAIIYSPESAPEDEERIQSCFKDALPDEWSKTTPRVLFSVQASGFLDAFEQGKSRLQRLLDFLSLSSNYSWAAFPSGTEFFSTKFDRQWRNLNVAETDWAFVRDNYLGRDDRFWMRWQSPHLRPDSLNLNQIQTVALFADAFSPMLLRSESAMTSHTQRACIRALHSLRRSRQARSENDALSDLFKAIEHLCSGISSDTWIEGDIKEDLVKACLNHLETTRPSIAHSQDAYNTAKRTLRTAFNTLKRMTLRQKWDTLLVELKLEFNSEETGLIWDVLYNEWLAEKHGGVATIKRDSLMLAQSIIDKVLVYRLNSESEAILEARRW